MRFSEIKLVHGSWVIDLELSDKVGEWSAKSQLVLGQMA